MLGFFDKRRVERRREPRFEAQKRIILTLLGESNTTLPAMTVDMSGNGMAFVVNRAIPLGALVKVESDDSLILGEICHCSPQSNGFLVGLEIKQWLGNLEELTNLNQRLFGRAGQHILIEK